MSACTSVNYTSVEGDTAEAPARGRSLPLSPACVTPTAVQRGPWSRAGPGRVRQGAGLRRPADAAADAPGVRTASPTL